MISGQVEVHCCSSREGTELESFRHHQGDVAEKSLEVDEIAQGEEDKTDNAEDNSCSALYPQKLRIC